MFTHRYREEDSSQNNGELSVAPLLRQVGIAGCSSRLPNRQLERQFLSYYSLFSAQRFAGSY